MRCAGSAALEKAKIPAVVLTTIVLAVLLPTGYRVKADSPTVTVNAEALIFTDENKTFELVAESSEPLYSVELEISDQSVVTWTGRWFSSQNRCRLETTLEALKNGTATVRLIGSDGTVFATCQVTCMDLAEPYGIQVAGIEITNKNYQSVTGDGISGTIIYHPDTNTLTLKNTVLSHHGSSDSFERGAVLLYSGSQTLSLELIGKNEIRNVTWEPIHVCIAPDNRSGTIEEWDEYNPGPALKSEEGSFSLTGGGILIVQDRGINEGVFCKDLRIVEGTSLKLELTGADYSGKTTGGVNCSELYVANGASLEMELTECKKSYGISASKLIIGESGNVQVSVKNSDKYWDETKDAILLRQGGTAEINGRLTASVAGGKNPGRGIAGSNSAKLSTVVVHENGQMEINGDKEAFQYVNLILTDDLVMNAGADQRSAYTKKTLDRDKYVRIGKDLPVIPAPPEPQNVSQKITGKSKITKTFKVSIVKKKAQSISLGQKAKTSLSYKVSKKDPKKVLSLKKGKVIVKKKAKKGTYTIKIKVTAKATKKYKKATKTVTVKVKIK